MRAESLQFGYVLLVIKLYPAGFDIIQVSEAAVSTIFIEKPVLYNFKLKLANCANYFPVILNK
jgi:hypothetical protein